VSIADLPPLISPVPTVRVVARYRAAPRFAAGGRRVLLLAATPRAPIRAPCAGRVRFTGTVAGGAPSLTIACLGAGARLTLSRLAPTAARGSTVIAGAIVGQAGGGIVGLSLRRADGAYVDPLPLLRRTRPAAPPGAIVPRAPQLRLPEVRLRRPVRTLPRRAAHPPARAAAPADRWLGAIGSALGLGAAAAWASLALRRRSLRPWRAPHPVASRR
jgi:hypothetical protein